MDLTARENIYLNGAVLGLEPSFINAKFDEIVDFSELRNFLDVPLKNYSSGMVARIAFAIATVTHPDVLIADEILAVGDFLFQKKCEQRMKELMSGGTTVLIVSHSIDQIERLCNKVAWLDHGHIRMDGPVEEVLRCVQITRWQCAFTGGGNNEQETRSAPSSGRTGQRDQGHPAQPLSSQGAESRFAGGALSCNPRC